MVNGVKNVLQRSITGIFFVDILSTDIFIFRLLSLFYTETNAASDAE